MSLLEIIIYSLVQAVCEFLPISSSAHLAIIPKVLEIKDPGIVFDLFLHFGSVLAVIIYFRKKILKMFYDFKILKDKTSFKSLFQLDLIKVLIVSIVSIFFILIFKGYVEKLRGQLIPIASSLILFAIILSLCDIIGQRRRNYFNGLKLKNFIFIGFAQALAVFPGVSRSGITISVFRALGISREQAGEFSFLISIPIILAGTAYKLLKIAQGEVVSFEWPAMLMGIGFTFIFSYFVIHFFLKVLKNFSLHPFSVYRIILGVILLILA